MTAATPAPITATGVKGFLMWFQRDQPALYAKVAPSLPVVAPKAFTDFLARSATLKGIYQTGVARRSGQALGDYGDYSMPVTVDYSAQLTPVTVDYTAQLSTPAYNSSNIYATYSALPTDSQGNVLTSSSGSGSVASSANSGPSSMGSTAAIGSAIAAAAGGTMSAEQAAALAALVGSQLARAAAGGSPANVSSNSLGIPTVSSGMSTTMLLVLLAGAGAAVWAIAS